MFCHVWVWPLLYFESVQLIIFEGEKIQQQKNKAGKKVLLLYMKF